MSELKPGDRALIIRYDNYPHLVGSVVVVYAVEFYSGMTPSGQYYAGDTYHFNLDGRHHWIITGRLIRLPPDEEMRQRDRETEKPVAA